MALVLTPTGSSLPGSCMKVSPSVCLSLPFHCTLPAMPSAGRPPPEFVQVPPAGSLIGSLSKPLAHLFCSSHFRPFFSSVCNGFLSFGWLLLNVFGGGLWHVLLQHLLCPSLFLEGLRLASNSILLPQQPPQALGLQVCTPAPHYFHLRGVEL